MKKSLMAVLFGLMLVLAACGGNNDNAANNDPVDNDANNNTEENATDNNADNANDDANNDNENNNEGDSVDSAAAEEAYKSSCASCHGQDLEGQAGPDLTNVGADKSADDIREIIEDGQGSMPGGLISGDEADAVAEWLADHK